ncbi:MAG: serine/threonine-protein phosphatase [Acidobacteria bacterium]|nr:serine/threonine-protein phosphatase [Acidobacteriota bacterium]
MRFPVNIAYRTDAGREHEENQDSIGYICDEREGIHLLIVADGVGGAVCGQMASQLAVQTIRQSFFAFNQHSGSGHSGSGHSGLPTAEIGDRLTFAISEANRMVVRRGQRDRRCRGMGSTCAVLVVHNDTAWIAHAGDSRVYLVRENRIIQMTRDHSRVQRMLDDGLITEEEAVDHPEKHYLERALGLRDEIRVDLRLPLVIQPNDRLIVCTDGLTSLVWDEEIYRVVAERQPSEACESLIALANERGGHDNISVGIARIGEERRTLS